MELKEQTKLLYELCLLDQKIKDLHNKLKTLPEKAEKAKKIAQDEQAQAEKLEDNLNKKRKERQVLEEKIQEEKAKQRKWESRADQIRGERDYIALMSEIGSQKRLISDTELVLLEGLDIFEAIQKEQAKAQANAAIFQKEANEEWEKVEADLNLLKASLEELLVSKNACVAKLPVLLQKRYQQIYDRRAGQAVAVVSNETCQACLRTLPPQLFIQVMRSEVLESCPSCQRFLVAEPAA